MRKIPQRRDGLHAHRACRAALAAIAMLAFGDTGAAQSSRRSGERPAAAEPDRTIVYSEAETRCAGDYHGALSALMANEATQPVATVKRIRSAMPGLKGHWLFQEGGERRRQRDGQNRLIDGDKVCEEEIQKGGRSKCLRWEARAPEPPKEPPVPPPPMTKAEARLMKQIAEFVQNRGAPPEFLSNGKYTIMSERVATDLENYLAQPLHPALCTGAEEFLEFLDDQLPLLRKRAGDVAELEPSARLIAGERIAMLKSALAAAAAPAQATPQLVTSALATGLPAEQRPAGEARYDDQAAAAAKPASSALAAIRDIATMTLAPGEAAAVSAETTALPALARAAAALNTDGGSPLNAQLRAEARAAFRTAELAAHTELLVQRYRDLDAGLFANIEAARKAHARTCTCMH